MIAAASHASCTLVHVRGHDRMLCLTAGFVPNDALQQQLLVLNEEAKEVAEQLKVARADLRKNPSDEMLKEEVQSHERRLASLDEMRRTLVAALSGATHVDAWAFLPLLLPAQQVPASFGTLRIAC